MYHRIWFQYDFGVPVPLLVERKSVRVQLMYFFAFHESYWCMQLLFGKQNHYVLLWLQIPQTYSRNTNIRFNSNFVYRYLCRSNWKPNESNWCFFMHFATPIDVCSYYIAKKIFMCFYMASNASKMLTQQRYWFQYEFRVLVPLSVELKSVRVQLMFFLAFRESYLCM